MLGIRFKTKKELREKICQNITDYIIETSFFGLQYHPNIKAECVCVSLDPSRVRNVFAQITCKDNILIKVT